MRRECLNLIRRCARRLCTRMGGGAIATAAAGALITGLASSANAPSPVTLTVAEVAGVWQGSLGAGSSTLHLVLTVTKLSGGELTAELNSVDQGANLPVTAITVQDRTVRFEVKAVGGVYEGQVSKNHDAMSGTWTQPGAPSQSLIFKRNSESAATPAPAKSSGPAKKPITAPLDVYVPMPPTAVKIDGAIVLAYELHVTNMSPWNCLLTEVAVDSGEAGGGPLATITGATLEAAIVRVGERVAERSMLGAGSTAVIYVWISVHRAEDVPSTLRHRLTVKLGDYSETLTANTAPIVVGANPIVVSAPLRGDRWRAGGGPSNGSAHRRALIPIDGHAAIAQRFAIDWVRLYDDGKTFRGDERDNKSFLAYGSDALAVSDGVVTEVKDGIPENVPGIESRAVAITLDNIGGNHVVIDIGGGHFAFYAHLQPGSLRVNVGDKVHRGQILGLVGNSGNSTEPHLHFHISDGTSPLGSEGLPYVLKSFELLQRGVGSAADAKMKLPHGATMELPSEDELVQFQPQP